VILIQFFILFASITLFPHTDEVIQGFGFMAGLKHPVQGMDHLLAMLCVGMISSRIGKSAIWQVPLCFVLVMAVGCVIGFFGAKLTIIEYLIAVSILIFGVLLIIPQWLSISATLLTVALFAVVHGYAHGKEMPLFVLPEIYIFGFMVSTTVIHILGVVLGEIINRLPRRQLLYKMTGISLVVTGIFLMV
jgi:urease accessory protein